MGDNAPIIIINENADEPDFEMLCEDDFLEAVEQSIEYIDFDIPIHYSQDQLRAQILNIISFKSKNLAAQFSHWNKRTRQYASVHQQASNPPRKLSDNSCVVPAIQGTRLVLGDNAPSTIEVLKKRFNLLKSKEEFTHNQARLLDLEKLWLPECPENTHFEQDRDAVLPGGISIKLLANTKVALDGFRFNTREDNPVLQFDFEAYIKGLLEMKPGDTVLVVHEYSEKQCSGTVKRVIDGVISVECATVGDEEILIHTAPEKLQKNQHFVYPSSFEGQTFCKHSLTTHNITVAAPKHTDHAMSTVIPTIHDVFMLECDKIKSLTSIGQLATILNAFGLCSRDMDTVCYQTLRGMMTVSTMAHKSSLDTDAFVPKPMSRKKAIACDFLRFKKHPEKLAYYSPYRFEKTIADTEYHRTKHVVGQRDGGVYYFTKHAESHADALYSFVRSQKEALEKEQAQLLEEVDGLKKLVQSTEDTSEAVGLIDFKRVYTHLQDLESDNHKELTGVRKGDLAKLELADKGFFIYRREFIEQKNEVQHIWIKVKFVAPRAQNKDKDKNVPDLQKLHEVLDADELNKGKELLVAKNNYDIMNERLGILRGILGFYADYANVKHDMQTDCATLSFMLSNEHFEYKHPHITAKVHADYSDYTGAAEAEDEDRYMQAEQGDNAHYSKLTSAPNKHKQRSPGDTTAVDKTVDNIINYFGVYLTAHEAGQLQSNLALYHNSDAHRERVEEIKVKKNKKYVLEMRKAKEKGVVITDALVMLIKNDLDKRESAAIALEEHAYNKELIPWITALFIVIVQLKLPNVVVMRAHPACSKIFGLQGFPLNEHSKSLLNYCVCVLKEVSSNFAKDDAYFGTMIKTGKEELTKQIRDKIQVIVGRKNLQPELANVMRNLSSYEKQPQEHKQWSSFRPPLEVSSSRTNDIADFFRYLREQKGTSLFKLAKDMTLLSELKKDERFKDLSVRASRGHRIVAHNTPDAHTEYAEDDREQSADMFGILPAFEVPHATVYRMPNDDHVKEKLVWVDEGFNEALDHMDDTDDAFWNPFSSELSMRLNVYLEDCDTTAEIKSEFVATLLHAPDSQLASKYNVLRTTIANDLPRQLGNALHPKQVNDVWVHALAPLKGAQEKLLVSDLLKAEALSYEQLRFGRQDGLDDKISSTIGRLAEAVRNLDRVMRARSADSETHVRRSIYLCGYAIVYILYSLLNVNKGSLEDVFDISHITTQYKSDHSYAYSLGLVLIRTILEACRLNTFDTSAIERNKETLREKRKVAIIQFLDKLDDEDRSMMLKLRDLGLADYKKLVPEGENVELREDDGDAAEMYENGEEDMIEYGGEDPDTDNEDNDHWIAED
jgi:hypothetical protein